MSDWVEMDKYEEMRMSYRVPAYLKDRVCPGCGSAYIYPDYVCDAESPNVFYWYCLKCGASEEHLYIDWSSALENWEEEYKND